MGIGDIIKRAIGIAPKTFEGISPDEVELRSYQKEEKARRIKNLVNYYRKKRARENWTSGRLLLKQPSILKQKNVFANKR